MSSLSWQSWVERRGGGGESGGAVQEMADTDELVDDRRDDETGVDETEVDGVSSVDPRDVRSSIEPDERRFFFVVSALGVLGSLVKSGMIDIRIDRSSTSESAFFAGPSSRLMVRTTMPISSGHENTNRTSHLRRGC